MTNLSDEMPMGSGWRADYEEYARNIYGPMVNDLRRENSELKEKLYRYDYDLTKGVNVGDLMKAIKENPIALDYWNKIMLLLRLGE